MSFELKVSIRRNHVEWHSILDYLHKAFIHITE